MPNLEDKGKDSNHEIDSKVTNCMKIIWMMISKHAPQHETKFQEHFISGWSDGNQATTVYGVCQPPSSLLLTPSQWECHLFIPWTSVIWRLHTRFSLVNIPTKIGKYRYFIYNRQLVCLTWIQVPATRLGITEIYFRKLFFKKYMNLILFNSIILSGLIFSCLSGPLVCRDM